MKIRSVFCLFFTFCLLILSGCFQPVDLGETIVEKATAHLEITNVSTDEFYVLEGLELRNAEGAVVWDDLKLSQGQSRELSTELAGTFTIRYRVKDTWFSANEVKACDGGEVKIALNKSHKFLFTGEKLDITRQDSDGDGYPDVWEAENGFDPADVADGGPVYVNGSTGRDTNKGTQSSPYQTLAKALAKAGRGLSPEIRSVVVVGPIPLTLYNGGNGPNNPEYPGRDDSVFYLGKTRDRVTIRGEGGGALSAVGSGGKRVLYLGPGADIALRDITITGGVGIGGGVYASDADLILGSGTEIKANNEENGDVIGIEGGGIYMTQGGLVMEPGSSVSNNEAGNGGGVRLLASTLTMNGGKIANNYSYGGPGGLNADGSTIKMFGTAEISGNTAGKDDNVMGRNGAGVILESFSKLTMYDESKISGNVLSNGYGGGVYVTGESTLTMNGGEISGNQCTTGAQRSGRGGGVMVVYKSSLIMEGGVIKNNTAGKIGGGIYLAETGASLTIQGGTVYGQDAADGIKNTATTGETVSSSTVYGHAIYDARTGVSKIDYDSTVTSANFPQ